MIMSRFEVSYLSPTRMNIFINSTWIMNGFIEKTDLLKFLEEDARHRNGYVVKYLISGRDNGERTCVKWAISNINPFTMPEYERNTLLELIQRIFEDKEAAPVGKYILPPRVFFDPAYSITSLL